MRWLVFIVGVLHCGALGARAEGPGHWELYARHGVPVQIECMAVFDGELFASGLWGRDYAPPNGNGSIWRFDGQRWSELQPPRGPWPYLRVQDMCEFGGRLFVGGYVWAQSTPLQPYLAAWDGSQWTRVEPLHPAESRGWVRALERHGQQLVVMGRLSDSPGGPISGLAVFDGERLRPVGAGPGFDVGSCTTHQGSLVVFEYRDSGYPAHSRVYRFDEGNWVPMGSTPPINGRSIVEFAGELFACGERGIYRWNGDSWTLDIDPSGDFYLPSTEFRKLKIFQGHLYAAGDFTTPVSGEIPFAIRREDGEWKEFAGGMQPPFYDAPIGTVADMVSYNGWLTIGGYFPPIQQTGPANLAAFDGVGWRDADSAIHGFSSRVHGFLRAGEELYAFGAFDRVGTRETGPIVRWSGQHWLPVDALRSKSLRGTIRSAVEIGGQVHIAGNILQVGTAEHRGVASWNGRSWNPVGEPFGEQLALLVDWEGRLAALPYRPYQSVQLRVFDGSAWLPVGEPLPAEVFPRAAMVYEHRLVVVGGVRSSPLDPYSPALLTLVDDEWVLQRGLGSGRIRCAAVHDGELWLGGDFHALGDVPSKGLGSWNGFSFTNRNLNWPELDVSSMQEWAGRGLALIASPENRNGYPLPRLGSLGESGWSFQPEPLGGLSGAFLAGEHDIWLGVTSVGSLPTDWAARWVLPKSVPTAAPSSQMPAKLRLLQNPVRRSLALEIPQGFLATRLSVFDVRGRRVLERRLDHVTGVFEVSLERGASPIALGTYYVQIRGPRGSLAAKFSLID